MTADTRPPVGPPDTLTLALWPANVAAPIDGPDAWIARVDDRLDAAAAAGARLLMLPEYACMQWLHFAPADVAPHAEIAWMAEVGARILPELARRVERSGVGLLAGTMPAPVGGGYVNRAHLLLPGGGHATQDKLCLTPTELRPDQWLLAPGRTVQPVVWDGIRLAVVVCLDVELPALAARLQHLDLDLVLVPSMTARLAGHHRVSACARARAVEQFTTVAVVGTVGTLVRGDQAEPNVGGAAVFVPCETALGSDGVAAWMDPIDGVDGDGPGPLVVARDVPLGAIRRLKRPGAAEAWPGPWDADGVRLAAPVDCPAPRERTVPPTPRS